MTKFFVLLLLPIMVFSSQLLPTIRLQPFWHSCERTSNYHGKFGTVGSEELDPEFEPYSAFIFENAVYWTGEQLNKKYAQPIQRLVSADRDHLR